MKFAKYFESEVKKAEQRPPVSFPRHNFEDQSLSIKIGARFLGNSWGGLDNDNIHPKFIKWQKREFESIEHSSDKSHYDVLTNSALISRGLVADESTKLVPRIDPYPCNLAVYLEKTSEDTHSFFTHEIIQETHNSSLDIGLFLNPHEIKSVYLTTYEMQVKEKNHEYNNYKEILLNSAVGIDFLLERLEGLEKLELDEQSVLPDLPMLPSPSDLQKDYIQKIKVQLSETKELKSADFNSPRIIYLCKEAVSFIYPPLPKNCRISLFRSFEAAFSVADEYKLNKTVKEQIKQIYFAFINNFDNEDLLAFQVLINLINNPPTEYNTFIERLGKYSDYTFKSTNYSFKFITEQYMSCFLSAELQKSPPADDKADINLKNLFKQAFPQAEKAKREKLLIAEITKYQDQREAEKDKNQHRLVKSDYSHCYSIGLFCHSGTVKLDAVRKISKYLNNESDLEELTRAEVSALKEHHFLKGYSRLGKIYQEFQDIFDEKLAKDKTYKSMMGTELVKNLGSHAQCFRPRSPIKIR